MARRCDASLARPWTVWSGARIVAPSVGEARPPASPVRPPSRCRNPRKAMDIPKRMSEERARRADRRGRASPRNAVKLTSTMRVEGPGQGLPPPRPPAPPFPANPPPGFLRPPSSITVELSEDSGRSLYQLPNTASWINFEVTNRREYPAFLQFVAVDDKGFVKDVRPKLREVAPGQSMQVRVLVEIPYLAEMGATDSITMMVQGNAPDQTASRSALLRVGQQETDNWAPSCSTKVTRNCGESLDTWKCQMATWSAEITLKDDQSGLLKVSAEPSFGLSYGTFYAGTKDEVKVYYEASCCEKEVVITAVDLQRNHSRCRINVAGVLTTGEITAIVLGVLLLIAIIAIVVIVIMICRRRKRRSQNIKL